MEFTDQELRLLKSVMANEEKPWKSHKIKDIKSRIKTYYRQLKNNCCYCNRILTGEFKMVIDIEHILPKGHELFAHLIFEIDNLNISCKRCNMEIKGTRIDFINDLNAASKDFKNSNYYKFLHPNFDDYETHIFSFFNKRLIKYIIKTNSSKAQYTFDFFKLKDLEIDSLNIAQGLREMSYLSPRIEIDLNEKINKALKKLLGDDS